MRFEGLIRKMDTEWTAPVNYYQRFADDFLYMNALIGSDLRFDFIKTSCLNCGAARPLFARGFCRSCFFSSPRAAESILRPELSRAHLGEAVRDLEWEKRFELQPHVVYLAFTGDVKVGVTRKAQLPLRWMDQGALQATVITETPNRYLAGLTEVALKKKLKDKTHWRTMLQTCVVGADLARVKEEVRPLLPAETRDCWVAQSELCDFSYPSAAAPQQIRRTHKFDKEPAFQGRLSGIKGQYLLFEDGTALNVRAHEGYHLALQFRG